jgi:hypothetical protein
MCDASDYVIGAVLS